MICVSRFSVTSPLDHSIKLCDKDRQITPRVCVWWATWKNVSQWTTSTWNYHQFLRFFFHLNFIIFNKILFHIICFRQIVLDCCTFCWTQLYEPAQCTHKWSHSKNQLGIQWPRLTHVHSIENIISNLMRIDTWNMSHILEWNSSVYKLDEQLVIHWQNTVFSLSLGSIFQFQISILSISVWVFWYRNSEREWKSRHTHTHQHMWLIKALIKRPNQTILIPHPAKAIALPPARLPLPLFNLHSHSALDYYDSVSASSTCIQRRIYASQHFTWTWF